MSIWTCDRRPVRGPVRGPVCWIVLALLFGSLTGCLDLPAQQGRALQKVAVAGGDVVIEGPRGYCVDPVALRRMADGAFALLASCNRLTGGEAPPVAVAVLTVSVLARDATADGPDSAAMARALAPAPVRALADEDGLALLQVMSGGQDMLPAGDPVHWRASMTLNGHLTGLAVYGAEGSTVTGPAGADLLRALAASLRRSSPPRGTAEGDG